MCVCARIRAGGAAAARSSPPLRSIDLPARPHLTRHTQHLPKKTQKQKQHKQGSAFYLGGAALVVVGWTIVGLALESYGFWLLFCEFFPVLLQVSWWYYEFSY